MSHRLEFLPAHLHRPFFFTFLFLSLILFAVFGSFLRDLDIPGDYWPVLLILLGVWLVRFPARTENGGMAVAALHPARVSRPGTP